MDGSHIKGIMEENLDFVSYLPDTFILNTGKTKKDIKKIQKNKKKIEISKTISSEEIIIERICSYLCSFDNFKDF